MKRTPSLLAAALLATLPLFAQDKAPAPAPALAPSAAGEKDADRLELMPSKPAQILPPPTGLPLIPEVPLPAEKPRAPSVEGRTGESPIKKRGLVKPGADLTTAAEDAVKLRVRMRAARTKAQRDPAVQAEWDRSTGLKTDYEKREVLRGYYKLLAARMTKLDPVLKPHIDADLAESLNRLSQSKIAPTQPPSSLSTSH